ncbi:uncharacterized protein LOC110674783 isoform X1 [Aedes aegypti]|uniref:Uncharacterized protein n=1 Tax=Aedes aegypti TaxID=7159 RepID=A0A6I8TP76_AEDAE|nr:uncharacterized protein LOC110674783 isoform X1 [Aedes aegypti]
MVVQKRSTTVTSSATFVHSATPSKLPRPNSRPPSRVLKPMDIPNTNISGSKENLQPNNRMQPGDKDFTMPKLKLNKKTSLTEMETSKESPNNEVLGDGTLNESALHTSAGNYTVSNYIQPEEHPPISSSSGEPGRLRRVVSRCSFVNICDGELRADDLKPASVESYSFWVTLLGCLLMLLSSVTLAVTLLLNYEHLMAIWYGWPHDDLFQSAGMNEGYFRRIANVLLKIWMGLNRMILIDE